MQTFTVINEDLIFKEATILFGFSVPNNENNYILYYINDFDNNNKKLFISRVVVEGEYSVVKDIKEKRFCNIKSYIEDFINGKSGKKEIKLNRDKVEFAPNVCQNITESSRDIECNNVDDIEWALNNLDDSYFGEYVYIKELNDSIYNMIVDRNKNMVIAKEKENIKGNINIFLLTLFAVIFLGILLFNGYAEFINR